MMTRNKQMIIASYRAFNNLKSDVLIITCYLYCETLIRVHLMELSWASEGANNTPTHLDYQVHSASEIFRYQ